MKLDLNFALQPTSFHSADATLFGSPSLPSIPLTSLVSISPIGFVKENVGGLKATKETNWLAGNSVKAVLKEKIEEVKRGSLLGARSWKVTSTLGGKV